MRITRAEIESAALRRSATTFELAERIQSLAEQLAVAAYGQHRRFAARWDSAESELRLDLVHPAVAPDSAELWELVPLTLEQRARLSREHRQRLAALGLALSVELLGPEVETAVEKLLGPHGPS